MSRRVVVERADRIDRIARTLFGTEHGGTVEALLDANPGLAAAGGFAAEGRELVVPERVTVSAAASVRPWE